MGNRDYRLRRVALAIGAVCVAIGGGTGLASWAMADTNGFYTDPVQRAAQIPAYARSRTVADDVMAAPQRSEMPQPAATATATPLG